MNAVMCFKLKEQLTAFSLVILSFCLQNANAQDLSIVEAEYAHFPSSNLNEYDSAETEINEFELSFLLPFRMKSKLSFLAGATYRHVFPSTSLDQVKSNLYFLGFNAFGIYKFSDSNMLVLNILPALSTSGNSGNLSSKNMLWQGGIFFRKIQSPKFSYLFGLLSTSRFGRPILLPALGLSYETPSLKFYVNFPFEAEALHKLNERFSYGLNLSLNGSQYNFNNVTVNNTEVDLARFTRFTFGPVIIYQISGPFYMSLSAGLTGNREYTFELENNESMDLSLNNGPYVAARLYFQPQKN